MALVMQVLGTRASRFKITMGKRNPSFAFRRCIHAKRASICLWLASAANRLVGSHPESELLLLGPNKAAAAAARLTTIASAEPKELTWVG
jgi:hypothetical protein